MIEEEGTVVEADGDVAKVAVLKKSACESCAAAGVCHPGDQEYLEASNPLGAKKGQKVKVVLAPQIYLKASLVLYGLPVTALIAGAIIAKNIAMQHGAEQGSDLWAFAGGMVCMLASFVFVRLYNRKVERTKEYQPVIVEILG